MLRLLRAQAHTCRRRRRRYDYDDYDDYRS
jgi:hypothetical protein